jgi:hypothetical protein
MINCWSSDTIEAFSLAIRTQDPPSLVKNDHLRTAVLEVAQFAVSEPAWSVGSIEIGRASTRHIEHPAREHAWIV